MFLLYFDVFVDFPADELLARKQLSEAQEMWLELNADKTRLYESVGARLGPSLGVKYKLEESWKSILHDCMILFDFFLIFLYHVLTEFKGIRRKFMSGGIKGRKQEVDLLALTLPESMHRESHPDLAHLAKPLATFIINQYHESMDPEVFLQFFVFYVCFYNFLLAFR